MLNLKKILIIAAHPDDGELGMGGTIQRMLEDDIELEYMVLSDCKESLPEGYDEDTLRHELTVSTRRLGLDSVSMHITAVAKYQTG